MSRLEGSSEATMEEILASIRKIIADEPASAKAVPEPPPGPSGLPLPAAAEPLIPEAPAAPPRATAMPQFRSAAPTTPSASDTPLPTPPRSRASAIDDDLAGLIDAPATAPKATDGATAVSPVEAAREKWANLLNPGGGPNSSPVRMPSAPKVDSTPASAPAAATATPAAPLTPPSGSGIFAPRKGGFYPPQEPARAESSLTVPSGFMPATKASEPAPTPVVRSNTTPAAAETPDSTAKSPSASEVVAKIAVPSGSVTEAVPDVTAASARALDALAAGLNKSAVSVAEKPVAAETRAVAAGEPFATVPQPAAVSGSAVLPAAERAATPGVEKAVPDTALNGKVPAAASVAAPAAPAAASQGRSFEEVVAEMLRPMLEKWIAENMPRIVERALKLDASSGPKSDS